MHRSHFLFLAAGALLLGCTKSGQHEASAAAPAVIEEPIKHRDVVSLPPVGNYLPPLDEGRVEVAPPAEWNVVRSPKSLVVFAKGKASELPRIVLTAEDAPAGSPEELTEGNGWTLAA